MTPLLEVNKLVKRFGGRTVLQDASFTLYPAEAAVLAGPNGSGKSTLLRILAGLLRPDSGTIRLLGQAADFRGAAAPGLSRRIGYVPERMPFLRFSPAEYLEHMGAVRGMDKGRLRERIGELLLLCRLEQAKDAPIRFFSKGMLQKVGIMQAMLEQPSLLLMDEPFSGLDVDSQGDLIRILEELQVSGTGLLFASHEPGLAARAASRLFAMDGRGTLEARELEMPAETERRVFILTRGIGGNDAADIAMWHGEDCPWGLSEEGVWFRPGILSRDNLLLAVLRAEGEVLAVRAEEEVPAGRVQESKEAGVPAAAPGLGGERTEREETP